MRVRRGRFAAAVVAILALATSGAVSSGGPATATEDAAVRALGDELSRSLGTLRLGDEPKPYFLAYRLDDLEIIELGASFGSLLRNEVSRDRVLSVELRVGSPTRDNTNFFSFGDRGSSISRTWNGALRVPLDDVYRELRRHAWLLTDAAYKTALENLARKRAALENRRLAGDLPDFTPASPARVRDVVAAPGFDRPRAESLVSALSSVFRSHPGVQHSVVRLRLLRQHARYLNSEESSFERSVPQLELVISAFTQAVDGTPVADTVAHYGRSLGDLPEVGELERQAHELARRLQAATSAPIIERYNGPVLFAGQAAGELFHQVFASRVAGWRPPVAEDERLESRLAQLGESLNDRIGGRVLARSMALVDDPTVSEVDEGALFGGYLVDDEGVPADPTVLVERGILKRLLSGRNPSRGVEGTTGNRRGASALPSNLLLSASDGRTEQELIEELLQLMEERELEYGVIVRRLANPLHAGALDPQRAGPAGADESSVTGVIEAVRLFPDGREEPVGDLRFAGLSANSFRDVVAASRSRTVYTAPMRSAQAGVAVLASATLGSALAGPPLVSVVVPDLLFEELTITERVGSVPRPPAIPHPFFEE